MANGYSSLHSGRLATLLLLLRIRQTLLSCLFLFQLPEFSHAF
jgi:hypothetical protein